MLQRRHTNPATETGITYSNSPHKVHKLCQRYVLSKFSSAEKVLRFVTDLLLICKMFFAHCTRWPVNTIQECFVVPGTLITHSRQSENIKLQNSKHLGKKSLSSKDKQKLWKLSGQLQMDNDSLP